MTNFTGFATPYQGLKSTRRACGVCHSRKVRCDVATTGIPCSNCVALEKTCEIQPRKRRKVRSSDDDAPQQETRRPSAKENGPLPNEQRRQSTATHYRTPSIDQEANRRASDIGPQSSQQSRKGSFVPFVNTSVISPTERSEAPSGAPTATTESEVPTSFVSRGAILPDSVPGLDASPSNQNADPAANQISQVDMQVLKLRRAFDLPPLALRQSVIDAYFERCWIWMPVVDRDTFAHGPASVLLLQAVCLAGSQMRLSPSNYASPAEYLGRAKALLDTNYEKDPLKVLAALCMIQWWNGTAPNIVSTTTSRFWISYAVCLAQQLGLHRNPKPDMPDASLRKRIFWSIYCRDNLTASAHGRPRLINIQDCSVERLTLDDFPGPPDYRNDIFRFYVSMTGILGDLCEMLMRNPQLGQHERNAIGNDLLRWTRALPEQLRLYDTAGNPMPYDFDVARLHIVYLSTVTVLFRPPSIYRLSPQYTASVVASSINCQLFEAFQLRDQAHFLSGAEVWQLFVAAIPQLASWAVPGLRDAGQSSLDVIEEVLTTLGRKLPSAVNNLRNVRLLRSAIANGSIAAAPAAAPDPLAGAQSVPSFRPLDLFECFGTEAIEKYKHVEGLLNELSENPNSNPPPVPATVPPPPLNNADFAPPLDDAQLNVGQLGAMINGTTPAFFENYGEFDTIDQSNWMMNWMFDQGVQL